MVRPAVVRGVAVAAGAVLAGAVAVAGTALADPHRRLTLEIVVADGDDGVDVTTDPVDITDQVCGDRLDCVQAYRTEEADYYRFAGRERAAEHAATLEDGFVVHYVVMDFAGKDGASRVHQRWAMERLAGTWQDYEGTFPDR